MVCLIQADRRRRNPWLVGALDALQTERMKGGLVADIMIQCTCGRKCRVDASDGSTLRCPACGKIVGLPSREKDPSRRDSLDSFVEATFELLNEVDGAFPTSGAR